jgi:hypothetical protein
MAEQGKSEGTRFSYGMELKLAQAELGSDALVSYLTPESIALFNEAPRVTTLKSGRPKSQLSIDKTRRVLRLALTWAHQEGLIDHAVVDPKKDALRADAEGKGAKGKRAASKDAKGKLAKDAKRASKRKPAADEPETISCSVCRATFTPTDEFANTCPDCVKTAEQEAALDAQPTTTDAQQDAPSEQLDHHGRARRQARSPRQQEASRRDHARGLAGRGGSRGARRGAADRRRAAGRGGQRSAGRSERRAVSRSRTPARRRLASPSIATRWAGRCARTHQRPSILLSTLAPRRPALPMHLQDALARFALQLEADGRSAHTIGQYRRAIGLLTRWLERERLPTDLDALTPELLARFLISPDVRTNAHGGPEGDRHGQRHAHVAARLLRPRARGWPRALEPCALGAPRDLLAAAAQGAFGRRGRAAPARA